MIETRLARIYCNERMGYWEKVVGSKNLKVTIFKESILAVNEIRFGLDIYISRNHALYGRKDLANYLQLKFSNPDLIMSQFPVFTDNWHCFKLYYVIGIGGSAHIIPQLNEVFSFIMELNKIAEKVQNNEKT